MGTLAMPLIAGATIANLGVSAVGIGVNAKSQKEQLALQREQMYYDILGQTYAMDAQIVGIKNEQRQLEIDRLDYGSQISSYQGWLDNYADMYAAETTSAQAQIAELDLSGKQQYQNLLNTLGYADAVAGATGRVGAGSSMAAVGGAARRSVTDYVGADMTLDKNGGLFGLQRTAADLNYGQLQLDLENQRAEALGQMDILRQSLDITDEAYDAYTQSIADAQSTRSEFQKFLDAYTGKNQPAAASSSAPDPVASSRSSRNSRNERRGSGRRR
jgi:multidrug efflux pump subunit AcrA (membrane-fusion protein)